MFKIGDFSKIAQVSIRSLRHYDKIGLFKPAEIDKFTGYRYYTIDQLPRLNRIVALKTMGLSLDQVATMLNEDLTVSQMREMLLKKTSEIRRYIKEEQERLIQLEQHLSYLEQEGTMPDYEIVVKAIPSKLTMSVREHVLALDTNIASMFYTLSQLLGESHVETTGEPSLSLYHDVEIPGLSADVEIAVPIKKTPVDQIPLANNREIVRRELPGVKQMACTLHHGGYSQRIAAHIAAAKWMEHNDYRLAGPVREVYHRHFSADHHNDNIIEIQFPIKRNTANSRG